MAYRNGNRQQMMLLPPSIENYVGEGDPVRAYDAFVEALNFDSLGVVIDRKKVGNPGYNPKSMLKLLLYGYSYGFRSSRKLERATHHNLSFIWLMGDLKPNYKTISEFRRRNKKPIAQVLKQCARLCIDLELIEGNTDVVSEGNDRNQFAEQINQANDTLEKECSVACADAGYDNTDELKKIDDRGIEVIVPQQKHPSQKDKSFEKESFKYDKQKDCYTCHEGHKLSYSTVDIDRRSKTYQITESSLCMKCQHFKVCTNSKRGRRISRLINEEVRERLKIQYEQTESQSIYKLRQQKVELPFGHMKRNLKVNAFLMRGRDGTKAETSLLATCFNMARMITILGVPVLVAKFTS